MRLYNAKFWQLSVTEFLRIKSDMTLSHRPKIETLFDWAVGSANPTIIEEVTEQEGIHDSAICCCKSATCPF